MGEDRGPVFVMCSARSGSTLMRFILDTHPGLACPPEIGPGRVCAVLAGMTSILRGSDDRSREIDPGQAATATIEEPRARYIRGTISGLYDEYLARRQKPRWCDKSLDNALFAPLLKQVFPDAQFICLYRHCMDVIDSGLEASPWGLSGFGFGEHAAAFPGNNVAAIGSYWLRTTTAISQFESLNAERCLRVRYEDLVREPEGTANRVFEFLGEEPVPGIEQLCLRTEHESFGGSDQKIWFTSQITTSSVGRGERIPAAALPPSLGEEIDKLLVELGYTPVLEKQGPAAELQQQDTVARNDPVTTLLTARLAESGRQAQREVLDRWPTLAGSMIAIGVGETWADASYLSWQFSRDSADARQAAGADDPPGTRIIATAATWLTLLTGDANMGIELVSARVRIEPYDERTLLREPAVLAVCVLLGISPVRSVPTGDVATSAGSASGVAMGNPSATAPGS
jgi:hypothetical protein